MHFILAAIFIGVLAGYIGFAFGPKVEAKVEKEEASAKAAVQAEVTNLEKKL